MIDEQEPVNITKVNAESHKGREKKKEPRVEEKNNKDADKIKTRRSKSEDDEEKEEKGNDIKNTKRLTKQ